jgi:ABC-type sugar transport system ATPase subunit
MGFVDRRKETGDAGKMVDALNVKTPSLKQRIGALSGGNQQKAIIARWLQTNPTVLILDEPTRGIDVSSKAEIHRLISSLARQGKAVIMVSSELPEILGMSDRVIVVREGELAGDVPRRSASQETLLQYAFGTVEPRRRG